jgi:thioredoxin reductase (NADPH)
VPFSTGRELVASLLKQAAPFEPVFHLGEEVTGLAKQDDGRLRLTTSRGKTFLAKVVIIAAGVGAFQPRRLKLEGIEAFEGRSLHYHAPEADRLAGQDVVIVGGDETAVQCALDMTANSPLRPGSITLLHRRDVLQAPASALAEMQALCEDGQMRFQVGQITGFEESDASGEPRLTAVQIEDVDGKRHHLPASQLLVFQGLSPKLGPVAAWGLAMERKQLQVNTEDFSTGTPGIFAVGDINTYPGKKKLIVCGFHECVLAAFGAAAIVFPDRKTLLQYTTTSPRLHQLLGVETPRPV